MAVMRPKAPITSEAEKLVLGQRNVDYGHPLDNFTDVAAGWSVLVGTPISAKQVPLMMEWLKLCRNKQSLRATGNFHTDTLIDQAGYALTAQILEEEVERRASSNAASGTGTASEAFAGEGSGIALVPKVYRGGV